MRRRKLLAWLGAVPILGATQARAEEDMPIPTLADIQSLEDRINQLQSQVDYKTTTNNPFVRSAGYEGGRVLNREVVELSVSNTAAETSLYSYTLPPGILSRNRAIRLVTYGYWFNTTGGAAAVVLRFALGGLSTPSFALGAGAANCRWRLEAIVAAGSTFNIQYHMLQVSSYEDSTATLRGPNTILNGASSHDALQPLTVGLTVDFDVASINLNWTRQFASLELI